MDFPDLNTPYLFGVGPFAFTYVPWPDFAVWLAYICVAFVLLWQRQSLPDPLRPVFALLATFALLSAAMHTLSILPPGTFTNGPWESVRKGAAVLITVVVLVLFRQLPRATLIERDARKGDLARLRLLATAVNASGDGVMIAELGPEDTANLSIVYANPAFESLTGYSNHEAVGCSPSILPDEEAGPAALDSVRAAMRGIKTTRLEIPSRRKNGTRLWIEWQVVPVSDEKGRHTHSVAVLRDTTERRRSELAIRESEERFRGLFEHAADAIFVLEQGGRIVDANRRACYSLGYTRQELLTMKVSDLDAGSRVLDLGPGETQTAENSYRRKDGSTFPVEVRYALLEAGGKRLKLGLVRDLTRRRRVEQTLRDREELLRNIITHIPCGVFWKDCNSVYLGCNEQVALDSGFDSPDMVIGRTDFDLGVTQEEAEFYRDCDRRVVTTGQSLLNMEESLTRADGTKVTLLASKVPLRDASGTVVGVLGVYQNITDRKRLEEQLRQAQKMDAVGRLAGGIAHDFNNLLTVIRGNADLLQATPMSADQSGLLEEVCMAADRAAGLVRQLLTFSRRQPVRLEVIDLNAVIYGLVGMLRRLLGERIAIETQLYDDVVTTRADSRHLEQVIMNLAVNARDAMPDGGTLVIGTKRVELPKDSPKGPKRFVARFWVSDNGVGMTEEIKARIFEPFFTTKGPDKGSGLGLATVFGIVEQVNGTVRVDSQPGAGTTFQIDLPWCEGTPQALMNTPIPRPSVTQTILQRGSVLLVEDEESVRKFVRLTLEANGYSVIDFADGDTAMSMVDSLPLVDVLVTDLTMPGIDGRDLAIHVRSLQPNVGVVVMSGYVPDTGWLDGIPGTLFLPKPFNPTDLIRAIHKARARSPGSKDSSNTLTGTQELLMI
jgi:two-component system cell cycle sensor histidine kinase/response regulator CckA